MARDAFASIMSSLDNPLIVVTTAEGDERAGCLVGFHAQSSIDPDRYCVWLSKANHTYRVGLRATHLAVHFLTAGDLALAQRFGTLTGDETDKFAGLRVSPGPGGVPVLEDCPHRLILRRVVLLDEGGDHVCVTSEPLAAESSDSCRILVNRRSTLARLHRSLLPRLAVHPRHPRNSRLRLWRPSLHPWGMARTCRSQARHDDTHQPGNSSRLWNVARRNLRPVRD